MTGLTQQLSAGTSAVFTTFGTVLLTAAVTLTSVYLSHRWQSREGVATRRGDLTRDLRATRIQFYAEYLDKSRRLFSVLEITPPAVLDRSRDSPIELAGALGPKVVDAWNDLNKASNAIILLADAPVRVAVKRVEYLLITCLKQRAFDEDVSQLPSMNEVEQRLIQAMSAEVREADVGG